MTWKPASRAHTFGFGHAYDPPASVSVTSYLTMSYLNSGSEALYLGYGDFLAVARSYFGWQ